MIIIYTILLLSFFAMSSMTYVKMSELTHGRNILKISNPRRDARILRTWNVFVYNISHVTRKSFLAASYRIIIGIENFFLRIIIKLGKKFSSIGHVVRGKDIPRNKGFVSFTFNDSKRHK